MPFDKPTRNALARMVGAARERLKADLTAQLQTDFRLQPDGTALPLDGLTDDQRAAALDLRALLDHNTASIPGPEKNRRALAFDRLVREIGFTVLNRLAALRLCEERELVVECVRQGMASEGFRLFDRLTGGALGPRYDTYRAFLESLFDELALDLGVLFDRSTPLSHVFPAERALEDVLKWLNDPALAHLWKEDETIGWIYQYYNDEAERKQMRDESQAPRNSRELAVRNQFFTPRYVVEFLSDNTLGRLWYEMREGDTRLAEECRYFVRTPSPQPLSPAEGRGEGAGARPKKDPREIKMLDPAGGSGHFGLYCFDLFEIIYAEAYDDPDVGPALQADYPDRAAFLRDVPQLILAHNIHIIDIDPRAVQIAALALWLRAQRSFQRLGLKPPERPQIRKVNVVCAEPMPGDRALLDEFAATLRPAVLGDLVRVIFDKMQLAGEAGSLLKIEEEIQDAIAEAKRQWLNRDQTEQLSLFASERHPARAEQASLFDLSGITEEQFWDEAEARVLEALQGYAELASNGATARRKLFAADVAHSFAFIDVCHQRYDVALMNPPFGEAGKESKPYIEHTYPRTKNDVFAAFVERWLSQLPSGGVLGAITSRTAFFLSSFRGLREELLLTTALPVAFADLGFGVLDSAMVETAAYCLETGARGESPFFRLLACEDKEGVLTEAIDALRAGLRHAALYTVDPASFRQVPGSPFAYWVSDRIRRLFIEIPPFEGEGRMVKQGLATADDFRFVRTWWEAPPDRTLAGTEGTEPEVFRQQTLARKRWAPFAKGGAYSPFYSDLHLVVNWAHNGKELRNFSRAFIRNEIFYFSPGLTWTLRTVLGLNMRALMAGAVFGHKGPSAFVSEKDLFADLGLFNSTAFRILVEMQMTAGSYEVGVIQGTPFPNPNTPVREELAKSVRRIIELKRGADTENELNHSFSTPSLLRVHGTGLLSQLKMWQGQGANAGQELNQCQRDIDDLALSLYGIGEKDRLVIEHVLAYTGAAPSDQEGAEGGTVADNTNVLALTADLVSYLLGCVFGRWEIRLAIDSKLAPKLQGPFDPLPVCSPGMLVGPDGLPAMLGRIVSEAWLRARPNAITLPKMDDKGQKMEDGSPATIADNEYPLKIAWDGILIDDPGLEGEAAHEADIVRRVREALGVLWGERADAIEAEACEILGVRDLREYFRKPSGFFTDHLKRYSKSRRQAPIYWPLSTASGNYTVWLYYHRLTQDTLFTVVNQYVTPKIEAVQKRVDQLDERRRSAEGKARSTAAQLEELKAFLRELTDFRAELLRVAALPYNPDLNDGVILNAAPLHKLFRLGKWAKDCKTAWDKLAAGDYDWAHIAYTLWPDRVKKACAADRSIAIAHGLEALYKGEVKAKKGKRGKKKKVEDEGETVGMGLE